MIQEEFIQKFSDLFEDTDPKVFSIQTKFHELDEYSSITTLLIIAMVDEEYNIALTGEDIKSATTIEDLFNLINNRCK